MEELVSNFKPLTSETRVEDFAIPKYITLGQMMVEIPESVSRKDPHFLINSFGNPVRAAWISKPLAHILNSMRFENPDIRRSQLTKALEAVDDYISKLIKYGVLRDKHGPGAMAFCQANENVPLDSILLSERSFDTLCKRNPRWKTARSVMAVRFPNLGPGTTQELKVVVNKPKPLDILEKPMSDTALGNRIPGLKDLLQIFSNESEAQDQEVEDLEAGSGIIDAFYIHPETLKECFEGDGDGDQIFIVLEGRGYPRFKEIDLTRKPGDITEDQIEQLFKKADRCDREDLAAWLPNYFDDVPIGQATYAIRWMLYNRLRYHIDKEHPMSAAWEEIAPEAIKMVEFVMDIRKGEWTDEQIDKKMTEITNRMAEIKKAQEEGNWFAKTVTSGKIQDIPGFVRQFSSLQEYVDLITGQRLGML